MTGEKFAQAIEDIKAALTTVIAGVVAPASAATKARVFPRTVINSNNDAWAGQLRSEHSIDASNNQRVHSWMVGFAGIGQTGKAPARSLEAELVFSVTAFWSYEFGTNANNSEDSAQKEIALVTWALAEASNLNVPGLIQKHSQLKMRLRLSTLGAQLVHQGVGELVVTLQPQFIR